MTATRRRTQRQRIEQAATLLLDGDRRTLARCISMIESTRADKRQEGQQILGLARRQSDTVSIRIGFSGAGGAGKSTLINALGAEVIKTGARLAILTVDPSSTRHGGSLLGDAIRMDSIAHHDRVFIRSTPSGTSTGGVTLATANAIELCETAGYDVILVESVGSGQTEFELAHCVDLYYWLTTPGAGDDLQAMKQGVLEWVDGIIISHADRGRESLAHESKCAFEQGLHLYGCDADVMTISALSQFQVEQLWQHQRQKHMNISGFDFLEAVPDLAGDKNVEDVTRVEAHQTITEYRHERARFSVALPLTDVHQLYLERFNQFIDRLRFQFAFDARWPTHFLPEFIQLFGLDGAEMTWGNCSNTLGPQLSVEERSRLSLALPSTLLCQSDDLQFWSGDRQLPLASVLFIPLSVLASSPVGGEFATISNTQFQFVLGFRFLNTDLRANPDIVVGSCLIARQWAFALQGVFYEVELKSLQEVIRPKVTGTVDLLTGVANREFFHDHLTQILASGPLAQESAEYPRQYVFALDLVGFRHVNEALGMEEGDRLLQLAAKSLIQLLDKNDLLARFGGDEFFIYKQLSAEVAVEAFGEDIRQIFESAVSVNEMPIQRLSCHIGCVPLVEVIHSQASSSVNPFDANEVLRAAGTALFAAKSLGLYSVFMYDVQLKTQAQEVFMTKNELYQALKEDQFSYLAQPLFNQKTKKIHGAELLLRWNHPSRGILPASEFIESADGLGVFQENDLRLIFKHLDDVMSIAQKYNVIFHLNLSAQLFFGQEIIDFAIELEGRKALPYLHFEITEHAFLDRMILLQQFIARVKAGGSQVWLDDFGVGYSGMRYLDNLAVDGIKIDQSFVKRVHQPRTKILFKGIVDLTDKLNLAVLAEGVESEAQASLLTSLGCDLQQGTLHGSAVSLEEFVLLLENQ